MGNEGGAAVVAQSPYFRIYGGAVWTRPGNDPLIRYVGGGWQYVGIRWAGMRFEGGCRLVLGFPREPVRVSGELPDFSIHDCILSTAGIPIAVFVPGQDTWRGAVPESWWPAFRIESSEMRAEDG
ncbi:MAG: hypothetical protein ACREUT_06930 [Steroidobacteraceae bacterium]